MMPICFWEWTRSIDSSKRRGIKWYIFERQMYIKYIARVWVRRIDSDMSELWAISTRLSHLRNHREGRSVTIEKQKKKRMTYWKRVLYSIKGQAARITRAYPFINESAVERCPFSPICEDGISPYGERTKHTWWTDVRSYWQMDRRPITRLLHYSYSYVKRDLLTNAERRYHGRMKLQWG